jgi:hypothetical protein
MSPEIIPVLSNGLARQIEAQSKRKNGLKNSITFAPG